MDVAGKRGYKKDLGFMNLVMLNAMGMIGSGWLFAELYTSSYAGAIGSIFSWLLGGVIVLFMALTFMEVSSAFPKSGGSTPIGEFSHGKTVGFIAGWGAWISDIMTPPIEAIASVTYISFFIPGVVNPSGVLLPLGYLFAVIIMAIVLIINLFSVKTFGNLLSGVMVWKWAIPLLVILTFIPFAFHPSNFTAFGSFYHGYSGIFYALVLGGVIFSFEGYRAAINMAGEAKRRDYIWKSVIVALVLVIALYVSLQVVFIGAIRWGIFGITPGDWGALSSSIISGPFAQEAAAAGLGWLIVILMIDAVISPTGAGVSYAAYPSRIFQSMSEYGYAPSQFAQLSNKHVPAKALVLGFVLGLFFIYEFPGWDLLIGIITSTLVVAYIVGPASINILRKSAPDVERPFTLKFAKVIAPVAFVFTVLVVYWSGWPLAGEVVFATLAGLFMFLYYYKKLFEVAEGEFGYVFLFIFSVVVFSLIPIIFFDAYMEPYYGLFFLLLALVGIIYSYLKIKSLNSDSDLMHGFWFIATLLSVEILAMIGPSQYGGLNYIVFPLDFIVVGIIGFIFYMWSQVSGRETEALKKYREEREI
ncbi:MAG: APC family permease [Ferroplasma sp.]